MNAWPSRCSSGPQNRIGIRLEPACTLISSTLARSTLVGSRTQLARLGAVADPHAVQLQQAAHDLDVADARHVVQPARRLAEQRRDHRLGDEVLGAAYPDLARAAACRRARRSARRWSTQPPRCGSGQVTLGHWWPMIVELVVPDAAGEA